MSWMEQLGGLLQRHLGGGDSASADSDFDQVAQSAPKEALAGGIADAFRSDQTPPFAQMVAQLFGQSDGQQRADLLNTLIGAAGPQLIGQLLAGQGLGWLGNLIGGQGGVTPHQASQVPPEAVYQVAARAEQANPSVIDMVSDFYARHPDLVRTLGAGALAAALGGLARRRQGSADVLPASQQGGQQVLDASQDPYGDPADQGEQVYDASQDPYGDPADQHQGQQVLDAAQDPYGDPADRR